MNWFQTVVACSDTDRRAALLDVLRQCDLEPKTVATLNEVRDALVQGPVHLVFCDSTLPDGDFHEALYLAKAIGVPLVVTSLLGDLDKYLDAMDLGACDFIAPPYRRFEVESIVSHVRLRLLAEADGGNSSQHSGSNPEDEAVA